ncbi:MAG TPA: methyltransferase domain-containing protein [Caldilineaceae bacterium]|nr:methyltransferase domain-containing protein [Caldilineaceae bacterium]
MSTTKPAFEWGSLRRVTPISHEFGFNRGTPIDRYYVEEFLTRRATDIRGRVLEIGDASYTHRFGGAQVTRADVLHVSAGNPGATFVGDLTNAPQLPSDAFDCFVLTQTLHLIYDVRAALRTIQRILKPGGVLLATFPGISQVSSDEWAETWRWSFSAAAARRLFAEFFPTTALTYESFGNALSATAFLHGLAVAELSQRELDYRDPRYDLLIAVRAVKPAQADQA